MVVTPMLVLFLPPRDVIGLVLPLLLVGDAATLFFYWKEWDRKNVLALFPGAVVGIALGVALIDILPDREFKLVIGILALVFGTGQGMRQWLVPHAEAFRGHRGIGIVAGFLTGTISALAHQGGLVATLYLLPQHLGNRIFVATSTVIFFLINITKVPPYLYGGLITTETIMRDLWLVPGVLLGALVGVYLNRRIPQRLFAWIVLFFVLATGVKLVWDYIVG